MGIDEILDRVNNQSPFNMKNGIYVQHLDHGEASTTMTIGEEHLNIVKTAHGGFYFSLCDMLCGAVASESCQQGVVTIDARINYMRTVKVGDTIHAKAWLEKPGRRIVFTSCKVEDDQGKLLCTYQSTYTPAP